MARDGGYVEEMALGLEEGQRYKRRGEPSHLIHSIIDDIELDILSS